MKLRCAGAPAGPALLELRARERDHEERVVARPLEQVLDEVEQAGIGPLHVLEREHRRVGVGEALEEQPPGGEQVLAVAGRAVFEAEQAGEPGLDEAALLGVGQVLLECRPQLLAHRLGRARPRRSGNAS